MQIAHTHARTVCTHVHRCGKHTGTNSQDVLHNEMHDAFDTFGGQRSHLV